jgi:hypothetical protein
MHELYSKNQIDVSDQFIQRLMTITADKLQYESLKYLINKFPNQANRMDQNFKDKLLCKGKGEYIKISKLIEETFDKKLI